MKKDHYIFEALITNVVDGDTVDAIVDLGFYVHYTTRLRLNGIDTPELHSTDPKVRELAKAAKQWLYERIVNQRVTLQTYGQEKFGRFLADIYLGDIDINKELVDKGFAVPYDGGKKA